MWMINGGVMWWVSALFHPVPGVSVARIHSCSVMLQSATLHDTVFVCVAVPFTRWSSSHSTSRATRWCTGLHRRGCRGANGPCSRCAPLGMTALLCHSFGRESHMNSKSAPSSMNSREQTVMSKLARRWRKVGGCEYVTVCDCVRVCFSACMCACMFSCLHSFICTACMCVSIQQLFTAGSEGRIMLCSNVVYWSMLGWMFSSLKGPMETHIQHSSASVILISHRVWLWQSHEVRLKPNCKF